MAVEARVGAGVGPRHPTFGAVPDEAVDGVGEEASVVLTGLLSLTQDPLAPRVHLTYATRSDTRSVCGTGPMCWSGACARIVGHIGCKASSAAAEVILGGLARLEYH